MNAVVSNITQSLPAEIVDTDPQQIALYSQDVFTVGPPVCAIVRPRNLQEVQSLVSVCLERGTPIVTRGGGMSYTSGYLASAAPPRFVRGTPLAAPRQAQHRGGASERQPQRPRCDSAQHSS